MKIKFLTIDQVIEIHDTFLQIYGGLAGIRDHGLLASAVEMPRVAMFGEDMHQTIYDKASASTSSRTTLLMMETSVLAQALH